MIRLNSTGLFLLCAGAMNLASCSGDVAGEAALEIGEHDSALLTENRISLNKLAANRISLNKLATNRISLNKLAANRISLNKLATNRISLNKLAANRISLNGLEDLRGASERVPFKELAGQAAHRFAGDAITSHGAFDRLDTSGSFKPSRASSELGFGQLIASRISAPERLEIDPLTMGDLLTSEAGREVLSYVAGCALTEHQILVGSHAGTPYEFPGSVGLAPAWAESALDSSSQRWVSACLFARVNAHGVSVEVSLRGAHPRLQASSEEMAAWDLEEGAFWGNLFSGDTIDWNACRGIDQAAGERGALTDRDCTEPDAGHPGLTLCGFKDAGDCGAFAVHSACTSFEATGTYYVGCNASAGTPPVHEVITAFVRSESER
jgi:hypothetical protein